MILSDGDMSQYKSIKEGTTGDYLVKLNNYVDGVERDIKRNRNQQTKAK